MVVGGWLKQRANAILDGVGVLALVGFVGWLAAGGYQRLLPPYDAVVVPTAFSSLFAIAIAYYVIRDFKTRRQRVRTPRSTAPTASRPALALSPREAAQVTRRINGARKVVGRLRSLYFAKKGDPRTTLSVIFVESALALPREGTYHKYAYALTRLNDQQSLNRAIKELERKIESYENAPSGPAFVDLAERIKEAVLRGNRWMSDLCVLLNEESQFLHDQRNAFLKWAKEYNTMVDELVEFSQETKEIGLPLYEGGPTYLRQFNGQFSFGHELIGASGV